MVHEHPTSRRLVAADRRCGVASRPGRPDPRHTGPVQPLPMDEFEDVVADALDELPPALAAAFSNVVVVVEDEHPEEPGLLGLYEGVALTDREHYSGALPDRITLYRIPLCLMAEDLDHLAQEVAVTVVHEFAHHMGIDDDRLHELGWD